MILQCVRKALNLHFSRLYSALSGLVTDPPTLSSVRSATTDSIQAAALATYNLERDYALWSDSVAPEFRLISTGYTDPLAVVLGLRGATMRLLLHRPIVLAAVRQQHGVQTRPASPTGKDDRPRQHAMETQQRNHAFGISLAAVIETATMTVWLLERGASETDALSAPWYQLFYGKHLFVISLARWGDDTPYSRPQL